MPEVKPERVNFRPLRMVTALRVVIAALLVAFAVVVFLSFGKKEEEPIRIQISQPSGTPGEKVVDLSDGEHIERELMLVKVRAAGKDREEMKRMAEIFRGRIIDVTDKSYTVELTGAGSKLDAFLNALERGSILETVRTGASGIGRGDRVLKV